MSEHKSPQAPAPNLSGSGLEASDGPTRRPLLLVFCHHLRNPIPISGNCAPPSSATTDSKRFLPLAMTYGPPIANGHGLPEGRALSESGLIAALSRLHFPTE